VFLFEKQIQAIIDRKVQETGQALSAEKFTYLQDQLEKMRETINAFWDQLEAKSDNGTNSIVVTTEDVNRLFEELN
jgi:hypothetical protein